MSDAMQFYISTLLIYLFIDIIGVLGFNLQFGVAGIIHFEYIVFVPGGPYPTPGPGGSGGTGSWEGGGWLRGRRSAPRGCQP